MKRLILLTAIAVSTFLAQSAKAQNVNGVRLSDINSEYLEAREYSPSFSSKLFISLEYGQKVIDFSETIIKDDDRRNLEFNSGIDFVNKMKSYGYELFQFQLLERGEVRPLKYYILKKKQ